MSLPHALLTALLERSCAGSELASRFDRSIGFFWHATHQQIYRELARLEEAGWVESLPPESGRGRKRVYRVLPAGRKELKRWAAESHDAKPLREELMVRLRAEAVIGPTGVERDIERRLATHREKLALYQALEARDFAAKELPRDAQVQHLILQAGILMETLWVQWSENALKVLKNKP
ncbi:MAG TPA: PadR family transcriptional regulator [Burkholderiaceae bacterium]|nr:PadR family transcriptional regulator [Burkholderiaceae bacterium]